jgi:dihydroxyacid dehydratase/phosphogluconate dehydratase
MGGHSFIFLKNNLKCTKQIERLTDTPPLGTSSSELGLWMAREAIVGGRLLQIDNCIEIRIHSSKQMMPMGVQDDWMHNRSSSAGEAHCYQLDTRGLRHTYCILLQALVVTIRNYSSCSIASCFGLQFSGADRRENVPHDELTL